MANEYNSSEIANKIASFGKSAGRTALRGGKKAGKALAKGTVRALEKGVIKKSGMSLTKYFLVFILLFLGLSTFAYFSTNQDSGKNNEYIDRNEINGEDVILSNANACCIAFYKLISQEKSVYQLVEKDGKKELILPTDDNAVSDYFKNDQKFYLSPDLLFYLNEAIFSDTFVYPEAFLKPIYYDEETLTLKQLCDDDGNCIAKSKKKSILGKIEEVLSPGKEKNDNEKISEEEIEETVADYGLASILIYDKKTMETERVSYYEKKDILTSDYKVETIDIPKEEARELIKSEEKDVLTKAITFAGEVEYRYKKTTVKTSGCTNNDVSVDPNGFKELYKTVLLYEAYNPYDANAAHYMSESLEDVQTYCNEYGYILKRNANNRPAKKKILLYKYKSADSGIYQTFYNPEIKTSKAKASEGKTQNAGLFEANNKYLYDYLSNFSTYKPTEYSRSYETLLKMRSQPASLSELTSSTEKTILGKGNTEWEMLYNGSCGEVVETLWDSLVTWGYSEKQAAAAVGNTFQESRWHTTSVNSSSGASGLCQWLGGRKTQLDVFAATMGKDWTEIEIQCMFACMELSATDRYEFTSMQWLTNSMKQKWTNPEASVAELTETMTRGWERCGDGEAYIDIRVTVAEWAYDKFKGRTPTHQIEVVEPLEKGQVIVDRTTNKVTGGMTEEDKERFESFYHAFDDYEEGKSEAVVYTKRLTDEDIDLVLTKTNAQINNKSLNDESMDVEGLWSMNYFNDLEEKNKTFEQFVCGSLDEPFIEDSLEIREYIYNSPWYHSKNKFFVAGYGMPNCTCYAYGRRCQLENDVVDLPPGNAGGWFAEAQSKGIYQTGQEPRVGAVAVWSHGNTDAGHVAIVEAINDDGTIIISQSSWVAGGSHIEAQLYKTDTRYFNIKPMTIEQIRGCTFTTCDVFRGFIYMEKLSE